MPVVAALAILTGLSPLHAQEGEASAAPEAPAVLSAITEPAPSSDALALSRAIAAKTPASQTSLNATIAQYHVSIANDLLRSWRASRGAPCDREIAACREAAESLAREAAPELVAYHRDIRIISRAAYFDATMTRDEMIEAKRLLDSPSVQVLASALLTMANSSDWTPDVRERVGRATSAAQAANPPISGQTLSDRFYEMTADLPRARPPAIPPPPRR